MKKLSMVLHEQVEGQLLTPGLLTYLIWNFKFIIAMFEISFPKEKENKLELIEIIEGRFKFEFPPLYKSLVINYNTSFFQFFPTINKWFKYGGLELEIYMSDKDYEDFAFNSINSPLRVYNDLIEYPFAIEALVSYEQLFIGNFGQRNIFVGIGENNKDVIYSHVIENEEIIPKVLEKDIFMFISKYRITLPISVEQKEKGLLEKYWLNKREEILLDMAEFEPCGNDLGSIDLDSLVDNIYIEILNYVQS